MRKLAFAMCGLLLLGSAAADTITFNTQVGSYGTWQTTVGAPGIQLSAYYYINNAWQHANLFGRNQAPDDVGVGICDPAETASCGTGSGDGDYNEISNEKYPEIIRIKLPAGYHWSSVQLSSLDTNSGTPVEHGILYASSSGTPGVPGSIGTVICDFAATGPQTCVGTGVGTSDDPVFTIGSGFANSQYLFLEARDWSNLANKNNDFLLRDVVVNTPEPGSLLLLGSGLFGLAGAIRRRLA